MADDKQGKNTKRRAATMREQAESAKSKQEQPRRLQKTASTAARPFRWVVRTGQKEYFLPVPKSRFWQFMNKRRHWIPKYFRESWKELKTVAWPNRKETRQLTLAVFMFAIVFGVVITVTDYGLDKVFKRLILKH